MEDALQHSHIQCFHKNETAKQKINHFCICIPVNTLRAQKTNHTTLCQIKKIHYLATLIVFYIQIKNSYSDKASQAKSPCVRETEPVGLHKAPVMADGQALK